MNKNIKEKYFKQIGVNIIKLKKNKNFENDIFEVYLHLKKLGFNRVLIESGIEYINEVLKHDLVKNFHLFKTSFKLRNDGMNNTKPFLIKELKTTIKNKVKINLDGDSLYKIEL